MVRQDKKQACGQRNRQRWKEENKMENTSKVITEDSNMIVVEDSARENSRVAVLSIIVEDWDAVDRINRLLHEYGKYIIGRMGIPYHHKKMNIISVVMDAPQSMVSSLSGKLGMISGVTSKCMYAKR